MEKSILLDECQSIIEELRKKEAIIPEEILNIQTLLEDLDKNMKLISSSIQVAKEDPDKYKDKLLENEKIFRSQSEKLDAIVSLYEHLSEKEDITIKDPKLCS